MSQASYDLALILDNDTANGGVQVKRYDGDSGAYFGSFGAGYMSLASSFAADVNSGTCLVGSNAFGIRRFDYSTGAFLGSPSTITVRSLTFANGNYFGTTSGVTNTLTKVSATGTYTGCFFPVSTSWTWVTAGIDGSLLACDETNGDIYRTTAATPTAGSWAKIGDFSTTLFSGSNFAVASYLYGPSGINLAEIVCINDAGSIQWIDFSTNYSSQSGTSTYGVAPFTSVTAMAPGHYGIYEAGPTATGFQCTRFDSVHLPLGTFGSSQLKGPLAMSVILAPEPGIWLSFLGGVGALALIARRNRQ